MVMKESNPSAESCSTCFTLLAEVHYEYDLKTEKPVSATRRLPCCSRTICGPCIIKNQRFATYCPYCQISTHPSPLPQGLRDPPAYNSTETSTYPTSTSQNSDPDQPPPYSGRAKGSSSEKPSPTAEDVLHFLDPQHDTLSSLSLRYGVPIQALRIHNNIYADHLLSARRTILIPGEYYKGGVSLSPSPVEGEEEELRKAKVRRWMVGCKCPDYEVALLYLNQAGYDLVSAIDAYREDELWEKENPIGRGKTKAH